ncbi:serine/threonine-protein kinase [Streptomyces sp. B6B3]|uniref:serine/threonine-protein kinase n=1 Tax=Streptomyces sp. B6B3 TaxID=3153570 RepID=UPI00325E4B20
MRDQLLGGRYRLVRDVAKGGMGQVWEARDETLGRPVAVKVISLLSGGGSDGDEARARFLREARITARLQHPNIVTIHDLGETGTEGDRVPFLVMELVRGEGLDATLRQGGVVSLPDAARWGAQICDALAEAHDAGIMHRDIKPSNILVTPSGAVKVLDFGIARAADPHATSDRLTQTGFIVGTPPYMAPEQARGFPEPRSDLYALGCLLFELITGRLPFQAPDTLGYLTAHLTEDPPTPSSVRAGIPSAWDDLVLTLLHKDPTQRYPNAADLSHALRHLDRAPGPESPVQGTTPPPTTPATAPLPPTGAASDARADGPVPASSTPPSPPHAPASAPVARRVFTTVRQRRAETWTAFSAGLVGIGVSSTALAATPWGPVVGWIPLLLGPVLLRAPFRALRGKLEIHQHHLSAHWHYGRRTQIAWPWIRQIRVVPVDRPGPSTQRCGMEIELDPAAHTPLGAGPFTQLPDRERPTYWFGEVETSPGRLAAALKQHLPQRTRIG